MVNIKVALLSFSDGRERVHQGLIPVIEGHVQALADYLQGEVGATALRVQPIHCPAEAQAAARRLRAEGAQAIIVCQPVFGFPHHAISLLRELGLPTLLYAPWEPSYPALVGLLTIGGGLTQIGFRHMRLWGQLDDREVQVGLVAFLQAARAITGLRGRVVGQLGGRSMGLYTTAADGAQWMATFGVDLDHCDELEVVRLAARVPEERVQRGVEWLCERMQVEFDGVQLTEEKLRQQVRHYLAMKELVSALGWDAVALKCHYEMSEFQVAECIAASLLNDPEDWEGPKPVTPTSCEADADGALTMLLLHLATGEPSALLDVRFYDAAKDVYVLSNCGAAPTCFAPPGQVCLCPCTTKYLGGGAHVSFVFAPGPVTLARLTRSPEGYRLLILRAEAMGLPASAVQGATTFWPHAFVRLPVRPRELVQLLEANHVHLVRGDVVAALRAVCRLMGLQEAVLS